MADAPEREITIAELRAENQRLKKILERNEITYSDDEYDSGDGDELAFLILEQVKLQNSLAAAEGKPKAAGGGSRQPNEGGGAAAPVADEGGSSDGSEDENADGEPVAAPEAAVGDYLPEAGVLQAAGKLESARQQLEELREQIADLEASRASQQQELQAQNQALQEEIASLRAGQSSLPPEEAIDLRGQLEIKERDNAALRSQIARLAAEEARKSRQQRELEAQNESLQTELAALGATGQNLLPTDESLQRYTELIERQRELEAQNQSLQTQVVTLKTTEGNFIPAEQDLDLQGQLRNAQQENRELQARIAELEVAQAQSPGGGGRTASPEDGPRTFFIPGDEAVARQLGGFANSRKRKLSAANGQAELRISDPLVVIGIPVYSQQMLGGFSEPAVAEDASGGVPPNESAEAPLVAGGGQAPGRPGEPYVVSQDEYETIKDAAVGYAHMGPWSSGSESLESLEKRARENLTDQAPVEQTAFVGILKNDPGGNTKLVVPFSRFGQDIGKETPVARDSTDFSRHSMKQDDRTPLYIRLERSTFEDGPGKVAESFFGQIFRIEGFSLLSESFLQTKAEAMRLVRDVAKRAVGIENDAREAIRRGANEIVRDTTWTLASVKPEATGATASLFEAARDMMSIRSDLGRSWRSGPTVAMISRTASTSALDFINEQLLPSAPSSATRRL